MVNEQKAKAYDEALERARKQRDDYQKELDKTDKNSQLAAILRGGISAIELAFPELTESEDEKIRKSLIDFLTDIKEISENGRTVWAVRKEDAEMCESSIAYLEKQKENPKSADSIPSDCTSDAKYEDRWHKVMFKNFMFNELGITKEDIRMWVEEAVRDEARKIVSKTYNDFDVEREFRRVINEPYSPIRQDIESRVIRELLGKFEINIIEKK